MAHRAVIFATAQLSCWHNLHRLAVDVVVLFVVIILFVGLRDFCAYSLAWLAEYVFISLLVIIVESDHWALKQCVYVCWCCWFSAVFCTVLSTSTQCIEYAKKRYYTVSQKNCAKLFLSELCQISTNCENFWYKDGEEDKLTWDSLVFHLT